MAVLIKGMKMPNNCSECEFHYTTASSSTGGYCANGEDTRAVILKHWCKHLTQQIMTPGELSGRHSCCPLVNVSESITTEKDLKNSNDNNRETYTTHILVDKLPKYYYECPFAGVHGFKDPNGYSTCMESYCSLITDYSGQFPIRDCYLSTGEKCPYIITLSDKDK